MTKVKKYAVYILSALLLAGSAAGIAFTTFQISSQKKSNQFFDHIEEINVLVDNKNEHEAKTRLLKVRQDIKDTFWNKKINSNKRAMIDLMLKKLGCAISEEIIETYSSKAENYGDFSIVKEAILRILFLEKKYNEAEKFRWEHGMQRLHMLTTLKFDIKNKNQLPKQLFDFYIKNLGSFNHRMDLESMFIIMALA